MSADELRDTSTISLRNNRLSHRSVERLASDLPPKVETLDLSRNYLETQGCLALDGLLKDNVKYKI
jgi:hypothetical protein